MRKARVLVGAVALVSLVAVSVLVPASASAAKSGITVSDKRLEFGDCVVRDVCRATLTFTNTAQNELMFDDVPQYTGLFGPEDELCSGFLTEPARLAPGGSCTDFLVFTPQEQKRYRGEACYRFVGARQVCVRLVGRGI